MTSPDHPRRVPHDRARELRRNWTEPEKRLWARYAMANCTESNFDGSFRLATSSRTSHARQLTLPSSSTGPNTSSRLRRINGERVCSRNTIIVFCDWNEEVLTNIEGVLARILEELQASGIISKAQAG